MRYTVTILALLLTVTLSAQLYVSGTSTFYIADGANVDVTGNLENTGSLINNGTLTLFSNWTVNNMYNGIAGTIALRGTLNQTIDVDNLQTAGFIIDKGGFATYSGDQLIISESAEFQRGVMILTDPSQFILTPTAIVSGGSTDSYLQGKMISQGGGNKFFPIGYQGEYGPITLLNVFGTNPEFTVSYINPNLGTPQPGPDLLGISQLGLWEIELTNGVLSTLTDMNNAYEITYSNENYPITNPIRHRYKSPVIATSDTPDGIYRSLGVETFITTDSLTRGTIVSESAVAALLNQPFYLAIGLAPRINPEGLFYIPQAFSPKASDVNNQNLRVFGEKIIESNFVLDIYNRFGVLVYSTKSFSEANQVGWNGVSQKTGKEEPMGTYFYFVKMEKENGEVVQKKGTFYLIR